MPKITFDSDEEFVFEEEQVEQKKQDIIEQNESSDDEAPEAVSISSSRSKALTEAKAQKEAAIKLAKADKEKRRQRDLQLKEQKKGSKREQKQQSKKIKKDKDEDESDNEQSDEEAKVDKDQAEEDTLSNNKLPQSILNEFKKSTETESLKRTHMTVEDFERLDAIREAQEKEKLERQHKRQKILNKGRMVGEYTVKIINQRPKVPKAGAKFQNMKNDQLHRASIPRRNATLNASGGRRDESALIFRRDEKLKPKSKSKSKK